MYCIFMKNSSLQNRISEFMPKKFYEIDSSLKHSNKTHFCFQKTYFLNARVNAS